MDAFGLLSSGLFNGMTVVAAGIVTRENPLNGTGTLAVVTSAYDNYGSFHDVILITPGKYVKVPLTSPDSALSIIHVKFSGSSVTADISADFGICAFILA